MIFFFFHLVYDFAAPPFPFILFTGHLSFFAPCPPRGAHLIFSLGFPRGRGNPGAAPIPFFFSLAPAVFLLCFARPPRWITNLPPDYMMPSAVNPTPHTHAPPSSSLLMGEFLKKQGGGGRGAVAGIVVGPAPSLFPKHPQHLHPPCPPPPPPPPSRTTPPPTWCAPPPATAAARPRRTRRRRGRRARPRGTCARSSCGATRSRMGASGGGPVGGKAYPGGGGGAGGAANRTWPGGAGCKLVARGVSGGRAPPQHTPRPPPLPGP
jgi:hypothetical protein